MLISLDSINTTADVTKQGRIHHPASLPNELDAISGGVTLEESLYTTRLRYSIMRWAIRCT
jgi:hypothetical protein